MNNKQKIGATGEFPAGRYNSADEGELAVAVISDAEKNRVLLEFGKEIAWIAMTPEQADGFGNLLRQKAAAMMVKIDEKEKEQIVGSALSQMFDKQSVPILLNLDIQHAVGLIGNLQIAFRHPANTGPTRVMMEKLVRDLIEKLDPERGDFYRLMMLGFDERYDE
jgi:hypothetical protein